MKDKIVFQTERYGLTDPQSSTRILSVKAAVDAEGVSRHYYVEIQQGYRVEMLGFTPEEYNEMVQRLQDEIKYN